MSEEVSVLVSRLTDEEKKDFEEKKEGKEKSKARTFSGFKAKLQHSSESLNIDVDVRFSKVKATALDKVKLVHRVGEVTVYNKPIPQYHWGWVDEQNKEYPKIQVKHYQVMPDGNEVEVSEFKRTKELKVVKLIPLSDLETFLTESEYEVWAENIAGLYRFAEHLAKTDQMAVTKMSFGGFKESYGLIYPIRKDGKFVLVMALTYQKKEFLHLMPITNGSEVTPETKPKATVTLLETI